MATDYRGGLSLYASPKASTGYLTYPVDVRDTAKSGRGCRGNRHLKYRAEFIFVNGGGSPQDGKVSSLPMPAESVGGLIVLGGRESLLQGEGGQGINALQVETTRSHLKRLTVRSKANEDDEQGGNSLRGRLIPGEPDAGKACTSGSEGGVRKRTDNIQGHTERPNGESAPALDQATRIAPTLRQSSSKSITACFISKLFDKTSRRQYAVVRLRDTFPPCT